MDSSSLILLIIVIIVVVAIFWWGFNNNETVVVVDSGRSVHSVPRHNMSSGNSVTPPVSTHQTTASSPSVHTVTSSSGQQIPSDQNSIMYFSGYHDFVLHAHPVCYTGTRPTSGASTLCTAPSSTQAVGQHVIISNHDPKYTRTGDTIHVVTSSTMDTDVSSFVIDMTSPVGSQGSFYQVASSNPETQLLTTPVKFTDPPVIVSGSNTYTGTFVGSYVDTSGMLHVLVKYSGLPNLKMARMTTTWDYSVTSL